MKIGTACPDENDRYEASIGVVADAGFSAAVEASGAGTGEEGVLAFIHSMVR